MRIAILTHEYAPFRGGVGRYVAEIADAARHLGHQVTVHAPDYGGADGAADSTTQSVLRFPGGIFRLKQDVFRYARAVRRFLRDTPADVVHVADWPAILICGWDPDVYQRLRARRTIVTLYGTDVLLLNRRRVTRWAARRVFRLGGPTAISSYTAALYTERFPNLPPPSVAHLGVSPFWHRAPQDDFRAQDARLRVVSVGRVVPDKGHATVIEAIGRLSGEIRQRVEYHVVGSGPDSYAGELAALARARQVHLLLRGRLSDDDVAQLYQGSWLHVLASRHHAERVEGFGLVLLEAALAGVPSIGTRVGGITELVRDGETGFLVDQDDAARMSAIMQQLAESPDARARIGAAAAASASTFTWERTARLTYDVNGAPER